MKQRHATLSIRTRGQGLHDITDDVARELASSGISDGSCTLAILHTSASLLVQENADPSARGDLERFLARLVPEGDPLYEHVAEGPDDMPSHVRAALTPSSLVLPVQGGRLRLGTWQGIFVWEHRRRPHDRRIALHVMGD